MVTGKTMISEEVFIEIAKTALSKIDSIFTASGQKKSLASIARIVADRVIPQIAVKKVDADETEGIAATVAFELKVNVLYGQNIPSAVNNVRETVKSEVESITGYTVEKIDVVVEKVVKPEPVETMETSDIIDIVETEE